MKLFKTMSAEMKQDFEHTGSHIKPNSCSSGWCLSAKSMWQADWSPNLVCLINCSRVIHLLGESIDCSDRVVQELVPKPGSDLALLNIRFPCLRISGFFEQGFLIDTWNKVCVDKGLGLHILFAIIRYVSKYPTYDFRLLHVLIEAVANKRQNETTKT